MWIPTDTVTSRNWCGPAALAHLLNSFGIDTTADEIAAKFGNHVAESGSTMKELREAAESYGIQLKSLRMNTVDILHVQRPVIVHMRNNHYVVVNRVLGDQLQLFDPAFGTIELHISEFTRNWSGLALVPTTPEMFIGSDDCHDTAQVKGGLFRRSLAVIRPYSGGLVLAVAMLVIKAVLSTALPLALLYLINNTIKDHQNVNSLALVLIGMSLIQAFLTVVPAFLYSLISNGVLYQLRMQFMRRVTHLSHDMLLKLAPADLLSRLLNDIAIIQQFMSSSLYAMFINSATLLLISVLICVLDFRLGAINLLTLGLISATYIFFRNPIAVQSKELLTKKAEMTSQAQRMLGYFETVQGYGREELELSAFGHTLARQWRSALRLDVLNSAASGTASLVAAIGSVLIIWVGGQQLLANHLTLGSLIAINLLSSQSLQLVSSLLQLNLNLKSVRIAAERFYEVMDLPDPTSHPRFALPTVKGELLFDRVSYTYPNGQTIRDMSFHIEAGSLVAIYGPNGGGKSTLLNLLLANFTPTSGGIFVDGQPLSDFSRFSLHAHMCYLSQDPRLFDASIKYNIIYGSLHATEEEINTAVQLSGLAEHLRSMPDGLNTILVRGGANLSAGQRQLVGLARAILKRPSVVICDEATSNLDGTTEAYVLDRIRDLFPTATILVVSHRPWVFNIASSVLLVNEGRVEHIQDRQEMEKLLLQSRKTAV